MRPQFLQGVPLPIFPCKADERPASPNGFYSATSDPDGIADLWSRWPGPLIGVRTGAAAGFSVLDIDRDGLPFFHDQRHRLPRTLTIETPRGGLHLWFQHSEGLRCSVSRISRGVDIRADGGYAIFWRAHACAVLCDAPAAPFPEWLIGLTRRQPLPVVTFRLAKNESLVVENVTTAPTPFEANWAERALQNAFSRVSTAPCGTRNHTLNAEAYALGRLCARGWMSQSRVETALAMAARHCGLVANDGEASVRATIASGLSAGLTRPYHDIKPKQPAEAGSK